VQDPKKGISVGERRMAAAILQGRPEARALARDGRAFAIDALGSGSDYTPFLQHLGVASLSIGFGGEGDYGQYHSIYDSIDHYLRFMDPDFAYGIALAKIGGRAVLRLSEADLLPFEFERQSTRVKEYVDEVAKLADTMRTDTVEHNRRVDEKVFEEVASPYETAIAPAKKDVVPPLDLLPLTHASERLAVAARRFAAASAPALGPGSAVTAATLAQVNDVLFKAERALTRPEGLPRRPWFKHQVYAPGYYTGYGVKTLPAVREAIEERQWKDASTHIPLVAQTLERYAAEVERAASLLEQR
jgi:N-acetylated-alpha-linked acidic dipeptidase